MSQSRFARRRTRTIGGILVAVALVAGCAAGSQPPAGPGNDGPGVATPGTSAGGPRNDGQAGSSRPSAVGAAAVTPTAGGPSAGAPSPGAPSPGLAPRVATIRQPVPPDLTPPLSKASKDLPLIYANGCHLGTTATTPRTCAFGDTASRTRVVLLGDSSAAQWFPALQRLAAIHHWRLETMTKSACTVAYISVWNSALGRLYRECATWRSLVLKRIKAEHPALVIAATSRGYRLVIGGRPVPLAGHEATFQAALTRTLRTLRASSGRVVLLGATPVSRVDPPACLAAHMIDATACATPRARAVSESFRSLEIASAASAGARWIDPTPWVCTADPCPAISGRILVYRNAGHLTATFASSLRGRLGASLPAIP